jgi:hypothetical protein
MIRVPPQRIGQVTHVSEIADLVLKRYGINPEENVSTQQADTRDQVTQLRLDFGDTEKPNKPR